MKPTWRARHWVSLAAGHVSNLIAGDGDMAARGHVQSTEKIEKSALAGTAGAHERDEFAGLHIEIEPLQDVNLFPAAAIGFVEVADLDETRLTATTIHFDHFVDAPIS